MYTGKCTSRSNHLHIVLYVTICLGTNLQKAVTMSQMKQHNQHILIMCPLLQEIPDSYDQPVVTLFTFLE